MKPKLIIFTDVGDTIINEGSEVRDRPFGVVFSAECIPGARETMLELYRRGYTIAMVADGLVQSFRNTLTQNGLDHIFSAKVASEELGVEKPDLLMFQTAMDRLGLTESDKARVIMVGNNICRDVTGANRFGIRSVLMDWSPRYSYEAHNDSEVPDYRIHSPTELLELADRLNRQIEDSF